MNRIVLIAVILLTLTGCREDVIQEPDKLLTEDQMVDILYDMAVLEGIRASDYQSMAARGIKPSSYIYKKYNIDSLQLAQNEKYYAANIELYARVYERVGRRAENNKRRADSLAAIVPRPAHGNLPLRKDSLPEQGKIKTLTEPSPLNSDKPRQ